MIDIACFVFLLAVVFIIGWQAGRNSVPEFVRAVDKQIERGPCMQGY